MFIKKCSTKLGQDLWTRQRSNQAVQQKTGKPGEDAYLSDPHMQTDAFRNASQEKNTFVYSIRVFICSSLFVNRSIQTTVSESINITDKCVERLKNIAGAGDNLRIVVEGGGCVGFQYKFELDDKINEDDKVFEKDNVKVVIDSTSLNFINGSTVDYEEQLIRSSFKITNNPKATVGCSCGASFSVKLE